MFLGFCIFYEGSPKITMSLTYRESEDKAVEMFMKSYPHLGSWERAQSKGYEIGKLYSCSTAEDLILPWDCVMCEERK